MENKKYQQPNNRVETTTTVKGSKFLAIVEPIFCSEEAQVVIRNWKKTHPKANHHCYAYRLNAMGNEFRYSDDGEPPGTAGLPILQQLQSFQASNTLITIIRYFGGTLLGTSGLIKAYKQAARASLEQVQWLPIVNIKKIVVYCAYPTVNRLLQEAKKMDFVICEQDFQLQCRFVLQGAQEKTDTFCQLLKQLNIATEIIVN